MVQEVKKTSLGTTWNEETYENDYHKLKSPWSKHWKVQYMNVTGLVKPESSDVILDIGCGTGKYEAKYSKIVKKIVGLELDNNIIKWANKYASEEGRIGHFSFVKIDDIKISKRFKANTFTKVMMIDLVEHISDAVILEYLKEFKKIMKKDGKLIIYTPNKYHLSEMLRKDAGHVNLFTLTRLKNLVKKAGFSVEKAYYRPSHVRILNFFESVIPITLMKRRLCIVAKLQANLQ